MSNPNWEPPIQVKITPQVAALIPLVMSSGKTYQFNLMPDTLRLEACLFGCAEMLMLCFTDSGDGVTWEIFDGTDDLSTYPQPLTSFDDAVAEFDRLTKMAVKNDG